jgi:putative ABC transport system substrate-binding protein
MRIGHRIRAAVASMTARSLLRTAGLSLALLAAPVAAQAQRASNVPRVGLLGTGSPADTAPRLDAFRQALRELGYVEGRTIEIESRWAEGRLERFPGFAVELVDLKVDVIFAVTSPAALAARRATATIPIVFATAADPVGSGLVASIAHPGGNVTGLSLLAPEMVARQLQLLKEAVPRAARVAVLSNPLNRYTSLMVKELEAAARSLGVHVQLVEVREPDAFDSAFAAIAKERSGALFVLFDPMLFAHRTRIAEFANRNRLPAMYPHREYAEAGGLMAYGTDLRDNFRRAASYVDRILRGAKPADLPVEQPTKFELVINMKTAKALGVTIPPAVLARADEVIR